MKMPGAQTGTYQQSLNRIVARNRRLLTGIRAGKELPNQRVKTLKHLLDRGGITVAAEEAQRLLILHGIMEWTHQEIVYRDKLRKARTA